MKKTMLKVTVFFIILAFLMPACQPRPASSTVAPVESEAVPTEETATSQNSSGPIEVTLWHVLTGPHEEALQKLVAEFNASHPDIEVKPEFGGGFNELHEKVLAALAVGKPPVIAMSSEPSMTEEYLKADAIVPMEKFIDDPKIGLTDLEIADVFPGFISEAKGKVDGNEEIVSWPFTKSSPVMYYRSDLLEKAGYSQPPKTWTEFREYAKKLTEMNGHPAFQTDPSAIYQLSATLRAFGCGLMSDDGTKVIFNEKGCIDAAQLWTNMALVDKTMAITSGYDDQNELVAGRASMILGSTVSRVFLDQSVPYAIAPIPDETQSSATITGPNAVIFKASSEEQQKAAWEFLKWFTDTDQTARFSIETGFLPIRASASKSEYFLSAVKDDSRLGIGLDFLPVAKPLPAAAGWDRVQQMLIDGITKAVTGVSSPQDAMDEAQQLATAALSK